MSHAPGGFEIKGWHVLATMIVFFGIIFAVNGVFLYQALSTHTGVISREPYRKGLAYNDRIAFEKAQTARGWTETVALNDARDGLILTLADKHGRPVSGLKIIGLIGRPSTEQLDTSLELIEKTSGTGIYTAAIPKVSEGAWMVDVEGTELNSTGEAPVYRLRKRLWVKP